MKIIMFYLMLIAFGFWFQAKELAGKHLNSACTEAREMNVVRPCVH